EGNVLRDQRAAVHRREILPPYVRAELEQVRSVVGLFPARRLQRLRNVVLGIDLRASLAAYQPAINTGDVAVGDWSPRRLVWVEVFRRGAAGNAQSKGASPLRRLGSRCGSG